MTDTIIDRLRRLDPDLEGPGFSLSDFAYARGNVLDAIVYLSVLWPPFVELMDMVFRGADVETEDDRARVRDALDRYGSTSEVERSFNWVDVGVLFAPKNYGSSSEEDRQLAGILREIWSAKLRQDFPGRVFTTEVISPDITGGSFGVRFFENR